MRQKPVPSESVAAAVAFLCRRVRTAREAESCPCAGDRAPTVTPAGESGPAAEHDVNELHWYFSHINIYLHMVRKDHINWYMSLLHMT